MSASMCSPDHLSAVADVIIALYRANALGLELEPDEDAKGIFHRLMVENCRSLECCYPSRWITMLGKDGLDGYTYEPQWEPTPAKYPYNVTDLADGLKAINCYTYQACEHEGWAKSRAKALCDAAEAFLSEKLARCHPAYDQAEWGWRRRAMVPVRRRRL